MLVLEMPHFLKLAQNPTILLGKVLRIDRDGKIPEDNPIENSPVYTLGHRNIYGIAFDNKSQFGLIAENGDDIYDEINIIAKGGNYGFPAFQPPNISPELANESLSIQPVRSYSLVHRLQRRLFTMMVIGILNLRTVFSLVLSMETYMH